MNATSSPSASRGRAVGVGAVHGHAERGRLFADAELRPDVARRGALGQLDVDGRRGRRAPAASRRDGRGRGSRGDRAREAGTSRENPRLHAFQSIRVNYAAPMPTERATDSGIPVPLVAADERPARPRRARRVPVHARRPRRRLPHAGRGRCASTPASRRPRRRTSASGCCSTAARPACRWRSTCRRSSGSTPTIRARRARSAAPASASTRSADMERLFDGIPLGEGVSTSMTINAPASLLLLLYELVGTGQGADAGELRGTIQNDILKEYCARGNYIFPPRPSMRLTTDTFRYASARLPRFNTISISGYHIREAGSTAVQELAFTLANGIAYVEAAIAAGPEGRRVRGAAVVLLQRPQRRVPGDREVPRRPPAVGAHHARPLRGAGSAQPGAALPRPDRRLHADRPAARGERRAGRAAGLLGRRRRLPVAAHERLRRGARPAHRALRHARAAHPAGARVRGRHHRHRRSVRRLVLHRAPDRRAGAAARGS